MTRIDVTSCAILFVLILVSTGGSDLRPHLQLLLSCSPNMSDEYASSGFKGSLVNPSISDTEPPRERESYPPSSDYATKNYPPPGDTTSSGGRRTGPVPQPDDIQQPPSGNGGGADSDLRRQLHDAQQGRDTSAESLDTRKEAAEALAARYRASRERLHEASGSSGVDVGA
ncbi:hypothetical protein BJV78DRAFT_1243440 [Lactifluus subvellereus]|nr:hypothetical protein BJV78DRAFT_1243440 [Lactifluus subvellereus]